MVYSDDRGAVIKIIDSTFKHSKFSKGLIVYEALPNIDSSPLTTVIALGREFWDRLPNKDTSPKKFKSEISVSNSTFTNVAMGVTVNKLSYKSKITTVHSRDVEYPYFDNYGAVLNSRGFPGTITFKHSVINQTLIHVPDVRPKVFGEDYKLEK